MRGDDAGGCARGACCVDVGVFCVRRGRLGASTMHAQDFVQEASSPVPTTVFIPIPVAIAVGPPAEGADPEGRDGGEPVHLVRLDDRPCLGLRGRAHLCGWTCL